MGQYVYICMYVWDSDSRVRDFARVVDWRHCRAPTVSSPRNKGRGTWLHLVIDERAKENFEVAARVGDEVVGLGSHNSRRRLKRHGIVGAIVDLGVPLKHAVGVTHVRVVSSI